MVISGGKLLTRVRLEGKRYRVSEDAIIDSGAAFTVIPPVAADFLELDPDSVLQKIMLITASGLIEAPVRVLKKLEVAGIEIENIRVVVHRIPDPAPIKVLLGMNFLENVKLTLNGKQHKFKIQDPN